MSSCAIRDDRCRLSKPVGFILSGLFGDDATLKLRVSGTPIAGWPGAAEPGGARSAVLGTGSPSASAHTNATHP